MDFYAGATETALFVLTEAGKVYRVGDVAAEEVDGPKVNLVPFEGVTDVAVNWLDEALIIVRRRNNGKLGIAQCAFGHGAYQMTLRLLDVCQTLRFFANLLFPLKKQSPN